MQEHRSSVSSETSDVPRLPTIYGLIRSQSKDELAEHFGDQITRDRLHSADDIDLELEDMIERSVRSYSLNVYSAEIGIRR